MFQLLRTLRRDRRPSLPEGLRWCDTCGEPRGITPTGTVAACYCSGAICNACDERVRRPISDYYEASTGAWVHVPYFGLQAHGFRCPRTRPDRSGFTILAPAPAVARNQEAVDRLARDEMRAIDEGRLPAEIWVNPTVTRRP